MFLHLVEFSRKRDVAHVDTGLPQPTCCILEQRARRRFYFVPLVRPAKRDARLGDFVQYALFLLASEQRIPVTRDVLDRACIDAESVERPRGLLNTAAAQLAERRPVGENSAESNQA